MTTWVALVATASIAIGVSAYAGVTWGVFSVLVIGLMGIAWKNIRDERIVREQERAAAEQSLAAERRLASNRNVWLARAPVTLLHFQELAERLVSGEHLDGPGMHRIRRATVELILLMAERYNPTREELERILQSIDPIVVADIVEMHYGTGVPTGVLVFDEEHETRGIRWHNPASSGNRPAPWETLPVEWKLPLLAFARSESRLVPPDKIHVWNASKTNRLAWRT